MQKKFLVVMISCVVFVLCGCGIFQKDTSQKHGGSKKDTQQVLETESESVTETELSTEIVQNTEHVQNTEIEVQANVETNSETKVPESPKVETPSTEVVTPKPETPKKEEPKVEIPKEEPPKAEELESESETPAPEIQRGQYLVKGKDLIGASFSVGDPMYDITVTTVNGETVVLSELLKEKDMVLLNFWATWCGPCVSEFPHMSEAYNMYKDDVEVIALSVEGATQAEIEAFRVNNNLPFKVGQCSSSWLFTFNENMTIPTSVFIDRYGTICEIKIGMIPSVEGFTSIFGRYVD